MTLALALCGEDFVVLAADKQETKTGEAGNYVESVTKLIEINDNGALVLAGPSNCEFMFRTALSESKCIHDGRIVVPRLWFLGDKLMQLFTKSYPTERDQKDNQTAFLFSGLDEENDLSVSSLQSPNFIAVPEKEKRAIGSAAQSTYFLNLLYSRTKLNKPSLRQLILLAAFCINETAKQDPFVGKEMDIWILRRTTGIEPVPSETISEARERVERISTAIADQFLATEK